MFRECSQHIALAVLALVLGLITAGCASTPGKMLRRRGDEIVVAGQFFHTGTRVVLWTDPGGFDAYRVERRFAPWDQADWDNSRTNPASPRTPNRYGVRAGGLSKAELERVRGGGWDLALLRRHVDQFVLHYDAVGTSRACFQVLQDERGLSTHFLLDLDGTIYQTLDVKERAWHATTSNDRSVGVEIANVGAFGEKQPNPFPRWYQTDWRGRTIITIPGGAPAERAADFTGRPVRRGEVAGRVQGQELRQYDFTAAQYRALARLTAALCTVLPKIRCVYPRDASGKLAAGKLPAAALRDYQGVLGHCHIQTDKVDPGPALQWDYVIGEARRLMKLPVLARDAQGRPMGWRPKLIKDN
ncbi:MAG TPA: peptidoglycan recognition family protein [Candidatus Acidoferrum sp.]|nr:peptidoglycan recognition family protein [Candidatus Acidoferrum sp.]